MLELNRNQDKGIRIIVLVDDELKDYYTFQQSAISQFLEDYSAQDNIYNKYCNMENSNFLDMVLLIFPFKGNMTFKRRPALVINDTNI